MRLPVLATCLLAALLLGGCFPVSLYYREGAPVARVEADETACEVAALDRVPRDMRQRYIPPVYDYETICTPAAACRTYRTVITPGRWESYDANEELRARVARQCMARKGYERVRLPACSAETIKATRKSASHVQPPITGESCIIRFRSGRYRIVTP
ncbi:hypothetical protein [Roseovarius salis]|uniref:hypothetical protein n=1 Tax=Roseovarius salis TaxID=3376063 RepID=UPI0037C55C76